MKTRLAIILTAATLLGVGVHQFKTLMSIQ